MKHSWITIALAGLIACDSRPELSREEVALAVENALVAERPCVGDTTWHFPVKVPTGATSSAENLRALEQLASAGLLRSAETTTTVSRFSLGPDGGTREATVPGREFVLTDSGRAIYKTYDAPGYGKVGAFCYGDWKVAVINFTDPVESSSGNLTIVTFTRTLGGVPPWVQSPELAARSTDRAGSAAGGNRPQERITLVRSDSGWVRTGF